MLSFLSRSLPAAKPFLLQQLADFSRYIAKARLKRIPMTTKRAGKGYYKGKGARKEGKITSKGNIKGFNITYDS